MAKRTRSKENARGPFCLAPVVSVVVWPSVPVVRRMPAPVTIVAVVSICLRVWIGNWLRVGKGISLRRPLLSSPVAIAIVGIIAIAVAIVAIVRIGLSGGCGFPLLATPVGIRVAVVPIVVA